MNEVLAVLYFTFWFAGSLVPKVDREADQKRGDTSQLEGFGLSIDFRQFEADIFVAFSSLMKYLRDGFLRELDNEDYGIKGHIDHFDRILHVSDEKVWENLVEEA